MDACTFERSVIPPKSYLRLYSGHSVVRAPIALVFGVSFVVAATKPLAVYGTGLSRVFSVVLNMLISFSFAGHLLCLS
jgi:hypothetical protein